MSKKTKKPACILSSGIPDLSVIRPTESDIRLGVGGDISYCALARTVRRMLGPAGKAAEVCVTGSDSYVKMDVTLPVPQVCVAGKLVPITDLGMDFDPIQSVQINLDLSDADEFIEQFDEYKQNGTRKKRRANEDGERPKAPKIQTFRPGVTIESSW